MAKTTMRTACSRRPSLVPSSPKIPTFRAPSRPRQCLQCRLRTRGARTLQRLKCKSRWTTAPL
ncbi:hypothetical protein BKA80DRAFT_282595 [Phyllosticta citrichinensis]